MSAKPLTAFLLTACALAACSKEDRPRGATPDPSGGVDAGGPFSPTSSGGSGGGGDGTPPEGGSGGSGGSADAGAPDDDPPTPPLPPGDCGDGELNLGEECDGDEFGGRTCPSFGFDTGALSCSAGCVIDTSGCAGVETCADGRDNDGDGAADCADDECSAFCSDVCSDPIAIAVPASVSGSNFGKPSQLAASCSSSDSGPEVVYAVTASVSGVLDVSVTSTQLLTLSVRDTCTEVATEQACRLGGRSVVPVSPGQQLFLVVDGLESIDTGSFQLTATERTIECGDFHRDTGEECDDGNTESGDGCSLDCALEPDEAEPNDTRAQADPFSAPYHYAQMGSGTDVDYVELDLPSGASEIRVQTSDFGDGSCSQGRADTVLSLVQGQGTTETVLATNDDGGDGRCSRITLPSLTAGTYYAVVRVAAGATPASFPYVLTIEIEP